MSSIALHILFHLQYIDNCNVIAVNRQFCQQLRNKWKIFGISEINFINKHLLRAIENYELSLQNLQSAKCVILPKPGDVKKWRVSARTAKEIHNYLVTNIGNGIGLQGSALSDNNVLDLCSIVLRMHNYDNIQHLHYDIDHFTQNAKDYANKIVDSISQCHKLTHLSIIISSLNNANACLNSTPFMNYIEAEIHYSNMMLKLIALQSLQICSNMNLDLRFCRPHVQTIVLQALGLNFSRLRSLKLWLSTFDMNLQWLSWDKYCGGKPLPDTFGPDISNGKKTSVVEKLSLNIYYCNTNRLSKYEPCPSLMDKTEKLEYAKLQWQSIYDDEFPDIAAAFNIAYDTKNLIFQCRQWYPYVQHLEINAAVDCMLRPPNCDELHRQDKPELYTLFGITSTENESIPIYNLSSLSLQTADNSKIDYFKTIAKLKSNNKLLCKDLTLYVWCRCVHSKIPYLFSGTIDLIQNKFDNLS